MASFSFGVGNLAKLLRIPLYAGGRVATLVVKRRDHWVFGCGAGIGDGALALWRVAKADGIRTVWLVDNDRDEVDARTLGIQTARKMSWRGFRLTARARVIVVTHGFGDVNRYATTGAIIAQLWHGIPLKRIGLDSPETTRLPGSHRFPILRTVMVTLFRSAASHISVIPVASHLVRGRIESAFALADERVIVTGEPRVDVLSAATAPERAATARARLTALVGNLAPRILLYAPTWRDGADDIAIPSNDEWREIVEVLDKHDAVLLIRSHPLGAGHYSPPWPTTRVRLLGSDIVRDVTPVLPAIDALITDYSSLLFDVGLIPAGVIYFAPDVASYARSRGFYGSYADVAGSDYATTWSEAVAHIDEMLSDPEVAAIRRVRAAELSLRVHDFRDGQNTQRVYREIRRLDKATSERGTL